ncbi:unnamed protein product [Camellia sinensis]
MEVEKMSEMNSARKDDDDDDDVPLPGFRFHPTDGELVGFYLRRKVEKRPLRIELIKQVDIYKYDPWDLPRFGSKAQKNTITGDLQDNQRFKIKETQIILQGGNVRDKEWYFFCKRGRKYRNSIRPNRVTGSGSGFWKATGIDRPIYSIDTGAGASEQDRSECIGLKKSLVYYRGSAGKGTKTDWMMHEFRLPADHDDKSTKHMELDVKTIPQEAEVWTLCRIFKRNVSYRKCIPDWRELSAKRNPASSKACSTTVDESDSNEDFISFGGAPQGIRQNEKKQFINDHVDETNLMVVDQLSYVSQSQVQAQASSTTTASYSSFLSPDAANNFVKYEDWDELRSVVEFAVDPYINNHYNDNNNM